MAMATDAREPALAELWAALEHSTRRSELKSDAARSRTEPIEFSCPSKLIEGKGTGSMSVRNFGPEARGQRAVVARRARPDSCSAAPADGPVSPQK